MNAKVGDQSQLHDRVSDAVDDTEPMGGTQVQPVTESLSYPPRVIVNDAFGTRARRAKVDDTQGPSKLDLSIHSETRCATSLGRSISFKELGHAIGERSRIRRYNFWLKFVTCIISIIWNLASPIKSYVLSFYGLPGDDLVFSHNLNWTTDIDYEYARALYDVSGVKFTGPKGQPIRFINMYQDFVVFNRASKWAMYLDDFQQDPYVGLFCRTSLVQKAEKINAEMDFYCTHAGMYAGNNYKEQKSCRVNEVSEAVMCLKGIDVLQLMNYEWQSPYDPNNTYVQQGALVYQNLVFPDLDGCLERRKYLVSKLGRDEGLHVLTQELAKNYSLDPTGFAGRKGLYAEYRYYDGFTDLSGKKSGVRFSKMSGSLPQRTQPIEPDLNALVLGRERLWWLVGETAENFALKVSEYAYNAPYLFIGMHIDNKATDGRFVERYSVAKSETIGICQKWDLVPTSFKKYPDPVYIESAPQTSVLTAYGGQYFMPRVIKDKNVTDPTEIAKVQSRLSTICLARDGCLDLCKPAHAAGWVATFDRSGLCQDREVSQSVINRQGYVDWRCFGEGTGKDVLSIKILEPVKLSDNTSFEYLQIPNVANPGAVAACVLGGRIPQAGDEPFPNVFLDLLTSGANTIITTTFSRGTEKVLVNVYALVSLLGCTVFSFWVMQNLFVAIRAVRMVKANGLCDGQTSAQLLDSIFTVNLSTVSHGRNIQLSKVILWLNLVTWYIGAADSNCTWWVNGVDLWTPGFELRSSDSPYYKCKPGVYVEHLKSLIGVLRLISISYNFYSLTCQHLILRGATRYARPFISPIFIFGVIPTFVGSVIITAINHLRLEMGALKSLHNQLFLVLLWVVYLFSYHSMLQNKIIGRLYVDLLCKCRLCGKQKIKHGSTAEALIGPYYLTLPEFVRQEEVEWIPISVAMESAMFNVNHLDFTARKYSLTVPDKEHATASKPRYVPQWVLDDDEYFFS